jgi:hypothetical protein
LQQLEVADGGAVNVRPLASEELHVFVPYIPLHFVMDFGVRANFVAPLLKFEAKKARWVHPVFSHNFKPKFL